MLHNYALILLVRELMISLALLLGENDAVSGGLLRLDDIHLTLFETGKLLYLGFKIDYGCPLGLS